MPHSAHPAAAPAAAVDAATLVQRARELAPKLAARAAETEAARRIPDATIAELQQAGLFEVLKPKQYGGYEMSPRVFYDICFELAQGCPSTGWIYGVMGVHNWQLALFDPRAAEDVWGEDCSTLLASTYMPAGKVQPVEGGFKFSGRWGFSSGCGHGQWFLLGGLIFGEAGQPPEYRTFLVPREDLKIIDTWQVMGLKGTGSNDVVVEDAFVPDYRTHKGMDGFSCINPGREVFSSDLYKLPFGQIFVRAVSTAAIGALQGAFNCFEDFAKVRVGGMGTKTSEQATAQLAMADTAAAIDEMRLVLHRNFEVLEAKIAAGESLAEQIELRVHYRYQAAQVVERCAQRVYQLFSACGGRGIFTDFPLYRYMNDIYAARAHFANNVDMFGRNYGSLLLGHDNTDVFI